MAGEEPPPTAAAANDNTTTDNGSNPQREEEKDRFLVVERPNFNRCDNRIMTSKYEPDDDPEVAESKHSATKLFSKSLYIVHLHLHGLIRRGNIELGRDADTGGQTEFVLNLATEMAQHEGVGMVEVITRLINDPSVGPSYARSQEPIGPKAFINRVPFGPSDYLRKEDLWPYLDELTDVLTLCFIQSHRPDVIHAHYADAGYVASCLSKRLGIPMVFTGHSYGQDKLHGLLSQGHTEREIDAEFNIWRRIAAEEVALKHASVVFTSTHQEATSQLAHYAASPNEVAVNAPGISHAFHNKVDEWEDLTVSKLFEPFLCDATKPPVLAISRLDRRKNIPMLVEAFGCSGLKHKANLILVLGILDDVSNLSKAAQREWHRVMEAIDRYNLHGSVAFPKSHKRSQVPFMYRWAAKRRGVFVNPALNEPFGLTCIESMASGLPVLATDNGGPQDILNGGDLGILFDAKDTESLADALRCGFSCTSRWQTLSNRGVEAVASSYSWRSHVDRYIRSVQSVLKQHNRVNPTKNWSTLEPPGCKWGATTTPRGGFPKQIGDFRCSFA